MERRKSLIEILYENKLIVIPIGIIIIGLIIAIIIINLPKKETNYQSKNPKVTLSLFGSLDITLELGEEYVEPGFYAIDEDGVIRTSEISIEDNIDTTTPGTYTITYKIETETKTRTVTVIGDNENLENTGNLEFKLTGDNVINLSLGEEYQELGFIAKDKTGQDLKDKVVITGEVDTEKEGTYTLIYTLDNNGQTKQLIRTVVVLNDTLKITIIPSTTAYSDTVVLNLIVEGSSFDGLIMPNQTTVNQAVTNYTVKENGTYTFTAVNKNGKYFTETYNVTTIDKIIPKGSCIATINNNNTTSIKVVATDNESGINNYVYYDNGTMFINTTSANYTYNKKTSSNVYVKVYDKAKNEAFIYCEIIDNSALPALKPSSKENVVKKSETETLKVYIVKKGSYYITRVWAADPYKQLNKFDSPEYGKKLYRPKTLLTKAKNTYNLNNKLILGFNASAIYLAGVYDASEVSKYSKYDKTSVGTLVITNGQVIRNAYNHAYKTRYIVGLDKENKLRIFTDKKATTKSEINAKKEWAQEVINSGIRNTFTHASALIENGKKSSKTLNMPEPSTRKARQAICQIDTNNFAIITGGDLNRSDLQNIMLNLNCQTGSNLDGGGSIALFFKAPDTDKITTIIGNGRDLSEVAYFTE